MSQGVEQVIGRLVSDLIALRETRATLVSLAMLGALVMGTAPAAASLDTNVWSDDGRLGLAGPRALVDEARPDAVSYADTFSSTRRLHPRFPADFPIPTIFILEHSTGGLRRGTITLRFRFHDDPIEALDALRDAAGKADWSMEMESSYRILFHKGPRTVAAWFGFPSHSLVLDLREPAGPTDVATLPQKGAVGEAIESPSRSGSSQGSIPVQPSSFPVGVALALALIGGAVLVHFRTKAKVAQAAGRPTLSEESLRRPIAAPPTRTRVGHHRLIGELPH